MTAWNFEMAVSLEKTRMIPLLECEKSVDNMSIRLDTVPASDRWIHGQNW